MCVMAGVNFRKITNMDVQRAIQLFMSTSNILCAMSVLNSIISTLLFKL